MAELAKLNLAAAPACPNCSERILDLNLEKVAAGAEHRCRNCGHTLRVPKAILDRLIAQRQAGLEPNSETESFLGRILAFFSRLFGR